MGGIDLDASTDSLRWSICAFSPSPFFCMAVLRVMVAAAALRCSSSKEMWLERVRREGSEAEAEACGGAV